jgi:hypothetical protein
MHQPTDIGGELLSLRPRQKHAVVERVEETLLRNGTLLLHEDAMHHRNLAGWSTETERGHAQPDLEGFAHRRETAL